VYASALARFGANLDVECGPAGYYPRGGGRVELTGAPLGA
jgi:RNA 3'-terminal phosphate cyclase